MESKNLNKKADERQVVCRGWRIKRSLPVVYSPANGMYGRCILSSNSASQHSHISEEVDQKLPDTEGNLTPSFFLSEVFAPYISPDSNFIQSPRGSQVRIKVCASAITPKDVLEILDRQVDEKPNCADEKGSRKSTKISSLSIGEDQLEEKIALQEGVFNRALHQESSSQRGWLSFLFGNSSQSTYKNVSSASTLDILNLSSPSTCESRQDKENDQHRYWGGSVGVGWVEAIGEDIKSKDTISIGDRVLFYTSFCFLSSESSTKKKRDTEKISCRKPSEKIGGSWGEYALLESDMVIPLQTPLQRCSKGSESCPRAAQKEMITNLYEEEETDEKMALSYSREPNISPSIRNVEAAAMLFPASTGYIALFDKLRVQPQESILVIGGLTDPVGFIAAQLAQFFGLNVWVSLPEEEEREGVAKACLRERGIRFFSRSNANLGPLRALDEENGNEKCSEKNEAKSSNLPCALFDHLLICSMSELSGISRPSSSTETKFNDRDSLTFNSELLSNRNTQRSVSLQDHFAKMAGQRWCEFILSHTCVGGNVCVTCIPPPDALLSEFKRLEENDEEDRMRGFRKHQLSLHFVFSYGLLQHPLTRSLLCQVGVKVCRLYAGGAFQLHCVPLTSSTAVPFQEACAVNSSPERDAGERRYVGNSSNAPREVTLHEDVVKVFSFSQLPEALVEEARRRNFFFRDLCTPQGKNVCSMEKLYEKKRAPPPLFVVLNIDDASESQV